MSSIVRNHDASSSTGNTDPNFPWDIATQCFVYLSTQDSNIATLKILAGNHTGVNTPKPKWGFTLGNYDFTGTLQGLQYPTIQNLDNISNDIPVFHVSKGNGTLSQIEIPGATDVLQQDYRLNFVGTNLRLILGFYIWAGEKATDPGATGGLTFSIDPAYWAASPNTTCYVQISNASTNKVTQWKMDATDNQSVYMAWTST